jgi:hypothetical protein
MPSAPVCADELRKLYDAIMALQSGQRVAGVNFGERSVQYTEGDLTRLQQLYSVFWRQCGADSGLVNLSAGNMVERGAPARYPR